MVYVMFGKNSISDFSYRSLNDVVDYVRQRAKRLEARFLKRRIRDQCSRDDIGSNRKMKLPRGRTRLCQGVRGPDKHLVAPPTCQLNPSQEKDIARLKNWRLAIITIIPSGTETSALILSVSLLAALRVTSPACQIHGPRSNVKQGPAHRAD